MTRKDYVALAAALALSRPRHASELEHFESVKWGHTVWEACVSNIADRLALDNSRFDRARFIKACEA